MNERVGAGTFQSAQMMKVTICKYRMIDQWPGAMKSPGHEADQSGCLSVR